MFPRRLFLRLLGVALEIHYKMTRHARLEALRIGLPRLSMAWLLENVIVAAFMFGVGLLLTFRDKGASAHWPVPLARLGGALTAALAGFCAPFTHVLWFMLRETVTQSLQISPQHLSIENPSIRRRYRWTRVSELIVTGDYICFCVGEPLAVLVPMAAVKNREKAQAFADQAEAYWRQATGREGPSLNPAVVWPPAPSSTHSQEPDRRV